MKDTKLIQILRKFSDEEWKAYEKFVDSPFFNNGRNYLPALKELRKFRPEFDSPKLTNEYIYSKVYKGKAYKNSTFKSMLSTLVSMAEEYLKLKGFYKNERMQDITLLKELREKNLYNMYDMLLKSTEKKYILEGNIDADYFLDYSILEAEKGYAAAQRTDYKKYSTAYTDYMDTLLVCSLLGIFETIPNAMLMEHSYKVTSPNSLIQELEKAVEFEKLLSNLKKNNYKFYDIIQLHYCLYKSYKSLTDDESYNKCRDLLFANYRLYTKRQLFSLFIYMESVCIRRADAQIYKYNDEMMKLYRFMFDKEILSFGEEENIPLPLFRNILIMARFDSIKWTDNFIEKNLEKLEPDNRSAMNNLWKALRSLLLKNFNEAIKYTNKIDFNIYSLKMDVKQIYLAAYYELGYYEEARSMVDSFIKYLNQNVEVAVTLREGHLNFLNVYKKLLKLKETSQVQDIKFLKKEVNAPKYIIRRWWLIEKIEEYKD